MPTQREEEEMAQIRVNRRQVEVGNVGAESQLP